MVSTSQKILKHIVGTPYKLKVQVNNLMKDYVLHELGVTQMDYDMQDKAGKAHLLNLAKQTELKIDDDIFYTYLIQTGRIPQLESILNEYDLDLPKEIINLERNLEKAQVQRIKDNDLTSNRDVKSLLVYRNLLYNMFTEDFIKAVEPKTMQNLFTPITKDNLTERYVQRLISDSKKRLSEEHSFKSYTLGFLDAVWENLERNGEAAGIQVEPSAINDCAEDYLQCRDEVLKELGAQIISKKSHRLGYWWGRFNANFSIKLNKPFLVYLII